MHRLKVRSRSGRSTRSHVAKLSIELSAAALVLVVAGCGTGDSAEVGEGSGSGPSSRFGNLARFGRLVRLQGSRRSPPDLTIAWGSSASRQCTLGPCVQQACADGRKTTVRGTVYDPAGKVPLYNVVVYVPTGAVAPLATVPLATAAMESGSVLAAALTDTHGNFVLDDVPVGTDIPLVMTVGKWRRQIKIPTVTACTDLELTDVNKTRLPRNQSEGDIPLIAIATGGPIDGVPSAAHGDRRLEFTTDTGKGRIHLFAGGGSVVKGGSQVHSTKAFDSTLNGGGPMTPATTLWSDLDHLKSTMR